LSGESGFFEIRLAFFQDQHLTPQNFSNITKNPPAKGKSHDLAQMPRWVAPSKLSRSTVEQQMPWSFTTKSDD